MRLVARPVAGGDAAELTRLRAALTAHWELVWRALRRFGVAESVVDDAAQGVFLTLAARLAEVPAGDERAFLLGAASGVAANIRRKIERARETPDDVERIDPDGMTPEELLEWKQRREALDRGLDTLKLEQRAVFVLFELEGLSLPEIARSLGIPLGTATSRLRRARESFEAWVVAEQQNGVVP